MSADTDALPVNAELEFTRVSVVIPARNEEAAIGGVVTSVIGQCPPGMDIEVIVVDDGSTDATRRVTESAGARVVQLETHEGGSPASARNHGARASSGDPIIFLDADCTPHEGWLRGLLASHRRHNAQAVGGSLALPPGLSYMARCDYYSGWYHAHPEIPAGYVTQHPPCSLSVRRPPRQQLPDAKRRQRTTRRSERRRDCFRLWGPLSS